MCYVPKSTGKRNKYTRDNIRVVEQEVEEEGVITSEVEMNVWPVRLVSIVSTLLA